VREEFIAESTGLLGDTNLSERIPDIESDPSQDQAGAGARAVAAAEAICAAAGDSEAETARGTLMLKIDHQHRV